jgi:hypothetical protein
MLVLAMQFSRSTRSDPVAKGDETGPVRAPDRGGRAAGGARTLDADGTGGLGGTPSKRKREGGDSFGSRWEERILRPRKRPEKAE